jgi:peptidyl-prolyl cis-trans isomerase A (cyclophilin A)
MSTPLGRLALLIGCAAVLTGGAASAQGSKPAAKNPVVVMTTSMGVMTIELNQAKAPVTVKNFLSYVRKGHYNNTIFHRVIPGFMVQGGGFTADMKEKVTDDPIKNEGTNGLKNKRGTLAMARTGDPNSATAQFFINVVDNEGLDYPRPDGFGYAVFGRVTKGIEVADKIVNVPTTTKNRMENVPVKPVVIKSVTIQK